MEPHRFLLFGGRLSRLYAQATLWKQAYVRIYLFNDIILFSHKTLMQYYVFRRIIPLPFIWIEDNEDTANLKNMFTIYHPQVPNRDLNKLNNEGYAKPSPHQNKPQSTLDRHGNTFAGPAIKTRPQGPTFLSNNKNPVGNDAYTDVTYCLIAESPEEKKEWMEALNYSINSCVTKIPATQKIRLLCQKVMTDRFGASFIPTKDNPNISIKFTSEKKKFLPTSGQVARELDFGNTHTHTHTHTQETLFHSLHAPDPHENRQKHQWLNRINF